MRRHGHDLFSYSVVCRLCSLSVYVGVLLYSAADWKLDEPDWTGRLRAVSKGSDVVLKLEDSNTGNLALGLLLIYACLLP